ncbi:hypothetical protein LSH36_23g08074 [Paralvinella palmiformis]|uniref:Cationic amino acid transporter C-terminal domain-containing protein n=1 Tax=Paralvinella palmiformis TaxID=53620 RepID=A0AAD9KA19_9ANNE|nr:hypothetical protein LSH36_23g08074 [Paralvinella palmiformis]
MAASKITAKIFRRKYLSYDSMSTPLRRCLTMFDLTVLGISNMISSGIYVLSGVVAKEKAGPAVILSYLFAGLAMFLSCICYAEFGARVPKAGSAFTFTYLTLGEICAFVVGWDAILERMLSAAASAKGWSTMMDGMFNNAVENYTIDNIGTIDVTGFSHYIDLVAFGVTILGIVFISVGVKILTNANIAITVVNVISLIIVIVVGFMAGSVRNWTVNSPGGFLPFGVHGIFAGTASLFYTFVGFESVTNAAEEASDPVRQIPKAILIALLFTGLMYVGASMSLTLMIPYNLIDLGSPFPSALRYIGYQWAVYVVSIGAVVGISTSIVLDQYGLARNVYAMSSDGLLFSVFAWVHPKARTPIIASLTFGIIVAILAMLLKYSTLIEFLSIGTLISFTTVSACVLVTRYLDPEGSSDISKRPLSETSTILDSGYGVTTAIQHVQPELKKYYQKFPFLVRHSGAHIIYIVIVLIVFFTMMGMFATDINYHNRGYCYFVLVFCTIGLLCSVFILQMYEQRNRPPSFTVPFVPYIPVASIVANTTLLTQLPGLAWLRYFLWLILGLAIYFVYGVRHSLLNEEDSEEKVMKTTYSSTDLTEKTLCEEKDSGSESPASVRRFD